MAKSRFGIGPRYRHLLYNTRRKSTGQFSKRYSDSEFNSRTYSRDVPQAFKWRDSHDAYYDAARGSLSGVIDEVNRFLDHYSNVSGDLAAKALEPTFELSQYYVPVDTGALKRSGELVSKTVRGKGVAEIVYARSGRPHYAMFVHEIMSYGHTPPTRAKFLESAIKEDLQNIKSRLAELSKGVINGNGSTK